MINSNDCVMDSLLPLNCTSYQKLKADCENCFGFCCVALYFSASEGFPVNKDAGKPCLNLQQDFRCGIHESLREKGLKGCTAYDCFGAGQKVARVTYEGNDWRQFPELAEQMYKVFLVMRQIHEMLWYLTEAAMMDAAFSIRAELNSMLIKTIQLTLFKPDSLVKMDMAAHRDSVNTLLVKVSELVRAGFYHGNRASLRNQKVIGRGADYIGADLRRKDMRGADLRGAYLIAADLRGVDLSGADLIGADLRDTDLRGANLANSIFLTQAQINSASGDSNTKLPLQLTLPVQWFR